MRQPWVRVQVPNVAQTPTRRGYAVPMEIKQKTRAAPPCPNDPQQRSRHCKHRKFGAQRVSTPWRQIKNVGVAWQAVSQRTAARAGTIPAIAAERVAPIVLALCATPSTMTFKLRGARSARIELHSGARPATDLNSEIVFAAIVSETSTHKRMLELPAEYQTERKRRKPSDFCKNGCLTRNKRPRKAVRQGFCKRCYEQQAVGAPLANSTCVLCGPSKASKRKCPATGKHFLRHVPA